MSGGKLIPQGQLLARVTQLHQRLLVSAASSLLPVPGPGPVGPRAARAAAKTWPTLALSGRAVAGEGRRVPGKVPAAAPPAQNCAERGDLGGDRGDAARPAREALRLRRGTACKHWGSSVGRGSARAEVVGTSRRGQRAGGVF